MTSERGTRFGIRKAPNHVPPPHLPDDPRKGQERWVTPRLSRLRDGRLVIICDQNDFSHVHEDQPPGIWIWFSSDDGRSWSEPRLTGVPGFEPDRIVELGDGTLLMASQVYFKATRKLGAFVMRSTDGGMTWKDRSIIAVEQPFFCNFL